MTPEQQQKKAFEKFAGKGEQESGISLSTLFRIGLMIAVPYLMLLAWGTYCGLTN